MKNLIAGLVLAGAVGMLPNPRPADATELQTTCLQEAIASCDNDFKGNDIYSVAVRGWCYMIRTAMCKVLDS